MNRDLNSKFHSVKRRKNSLCGFEGDNRRTEFHEDEFDFNFQQSLEEGEISSDSEGNKNDTGRGLSLSSKSVSDEGIQWSDLQILMIGDERVNDYNWKDQDVYPNQHFFHYKSATLPTLCEFIDHQINKSFDIVLIFAFHYDFIQQECNSPLFILNPKVNFENLTKTVVDFHTKWTNLYIGTKIIWVLPSALNFYEYNSCRVKSSKTFADLVTETEQHSLSKEYFEYIQKLSQCWRRNLKTIPVLPLNDVLFMKKHVYRKSFVEERIPKFPKGLHIDGLKPTKLMTGYLAYKLAEFMHEEGFFPLIKFIPNLKKTVQNVLQADPSLKKYVHRHWKKRESSHRHRYNKRRRHYSNSSSSESCSSSDSDKQNRKMSKSRHHRRSKKQRKISSSRSKSPSQSLSKNGSADKIVSHGLKLLDSSTQSGSISNPSEEVEFYRKLACLREMHDIQCNVYRCKPTTHPLYAEENKKFVNEIQKSNFSTGDIIDKWVSFWKIRLEELCNENWELKKGQMILDLKKKYQKTNINGGSKEQNIDSKSDVLEDNKSKILYSKISSSPSCALIDLTESPIKKEKLKIKLEDYKKMQRQKPFAIGLQEEIKKFLALSETICQESMDKKQEYPPVVSTEAAFNIGMSPKLISNIGTPLQSLQGHSSTSLGSDFKEAINNFLGSSKDISQESIDKKTEYPMCPSSRVVNTEAAIKICTASKLISNLGSPLQSPKGHSSNSSSIKEDIKKFLASSVDKITDYPICPSSCTTSQLMSNLGMPLQSPKGHSFNSSGNTEDIKKLLASSEDNLQKTIDVKIETSKCSTPSENSLEILTRNSASILFKSNSITPLPGLPPQKSNSNYSSDSEFIPIDSDCDIDVDMLMDDDDFLLDLKEIDEELKKAVPYSSSSSQELPTLERCVPQAIIPPEVRPNSPFGKHLPTTPVPLKVNAPSTVLLPKAIVPPNFGPTKLLPQAAVMPSVSYALKEKLLPKAMISPLRFKIEPVANSIYTLESLVKEQAVPSRSEVCADYVVILKMLFRLARHLGTLSTSITALYNAAIEELQIEEDALCFPDDNAKTILTLVNQKLNSLLKGDISQVQRAIFGEVSGRLRKLLEKLNTQNDKFSNVNIQNIALATIGQGVQEIIAFIKNTLLYHGYHNFHSNDVMNLYMSVKAAHCNMCSNS